MRPNLLPRTSPKVGQCKLCEWNATRFKLSRLGLGKIFRGVWLTKMSPSNRKNVAPPTERPRPKTVRDNLCRNYHRQKIVSLHRSLGGVLHVLWPNSYSTTCRILLRQVVDFVMLVRVSRCRFQAKKRTGMRRFILEWGAGPGLWRGFPSRDDLGGHGGRRRPARTNPLSPALIRPVRGHCCHD